MASHPSPAAPRLLASLCLTGTIMVAEALGGSWSGSLSLLADAGHMLIDVLALAVAYGGLRLAARPADARRTFGYRRLEVLAALLNGVALVLLAVSLGWEGLQRLQAPQAVDVPIMMLTASLGLGANLCSLWLLGAHHTNINLRGAFLHLLSDTLSSCSVFLGGVVIYYSGWTRLDALLSLGIALIMLVNSYKLLVEVIDVLLEAAPRHTDTAHIYQHILQLPGVAAMHDLHVWSITPGLVALSAHIVLRPSYNERDTILQSIQTLLRDQFAITHVTLQIEPAPATACTAVACTVNHQS